MISGYGLNVSVNDHSAIPGAATAGRQKEGGGEKTDQYISEFLNQFLKRPWNKHSIR